MLQIYLGGDIIKPKYMYLQLCMLIVLLLLATACSSKAVDHDPESYILGTWQAYQIEDNGEIYALDDYAATFGMEVELQFEFREDDTVLSVMQGLEVAGTYQYDGEVFAMKFEGEPVDVWLEGDDFVFQIAGFKYYLTKQQ